MTWAERLATLSYLLFASWLWYREGEHVAMLMLGFGIYGALGALLAELRQEIRSIKALLPEKEPKGT